jgi:hypothetical protein
LPAQVLKTIAELETAILRALDSSGKLERTITFDAAQGSFSGTWFRRYRRTEMELGRRVSFPRGFKVAARHETRCEWAGVGAMSQLWDRGGPNILRC